MKKFAKFITVCASVIVSGGIVSGLVSNTLKSVHANEPISITFFDKNIGSEKFNDRIAQIVEEKTGVTIEIQNATGDSNELLSLMLSSKDYADVIMMDLGSDLVGRYINSGALIPLNDLLDERGSNIKEMYGDVLDRTVAEDGNNYYLTNWYGMDSTPVEAFNIRYDYMVDIVGQERADSDEPFSQSEIIEIMKQWKEKYPKIDGNESIALTIRENGSGFEGMFGIKTYYEEDGVLFHQVKNPQYLNMRKFQNQLYREGLLDPEWVTNNEILKNQKLSNGHVFASESAWWDTSTVNQANVSAGNPDQQYVAYKVYADNLDPSETTNSGRSSLGWDAIAITDNAENPERIVDLIDFLASREGQSLLLWGVEGEDYEVDENGNFIPTDETLELFTDNTEVAIDETGIAKWTWFVNNQGPTPDTPNRLTGYISRQSFDEEMAFKNIPESDYWDTSYYNNLTPSSDSMLGLMNQKVTDIITETVPRMINASSEEEVETIYNQMLDELESAGLSQVEEAINENYQSRLELWGIN